METAADVIRDALQEILVQAAEAPIGADKAQTAIRYLNRMMFAYDVDGISLGYTEVTNLSDPITVPNGAIEAIIANLAIRLAKQFMKPVTPDLAARASEGEKTLLNLAVTIGPSQYPETLPVGSGNEHDTNFGDSFYSQPEEPILIEGGGFISVESETVLP